jgi:FixJ family two-component response regulator
MFTSVETVPRKAQLVAVVDDDDSVRNAIRSALKSVGLTACSFRSAEEFLDSEIRSETACLITDLRMPGMSGLEPQAKLVEDKSRIAIIFITAYADRGCERRPCGLARSISWIHPFDDNVSLDTVRKALKA